MTSSALWSPWVRAGVNFSRNPSSSKRRHSQKPGGTGGPDEDEDGDSDDSNSNSDSMTLSKRMNVPSRFSS